MALCSSDIVIASSIAWANSSVFQGLTMILPFNDCAAPANSLRIMTPWRCCWVQMYSYDTLYQHQGRHLRYQVHSISSTAYKTHVTDIVKGYKLDKVHRLMHIMNRHEFYAPELTVNTTNEFIHCCAEILVLLNIATRWNCDLNQDYLQWDQSTWASWYLANPFWMLREENFKGM